MWSTVAAAVAAAVAVTAAVLPPLHQGNPWLLLYSTARDGISLATLMRKAEKVRGMQGHAMDQV
jgi:hypothetical protein